MTKPKHVDDYEKKVMKMSARGLSENQIANRLGVSWHRVSNTLGNNGEGATSGPGMRGESEKTKKFLGEYFYGAYFTRDGYPRWLVGDKAAQEEAA